MKAMIEVNESAVVTTQIKFDDSLIQKFIDFVDAGSPQTVKTYIFCLKKFYSYLLDNNISRPTREDIKNYRDEMEETLRPASVKLNLNAVKMFFAWLSSENLYPNIGINVKRHTRDEKPELATHKRAALNAQEAVKVLKTMPYDNSVQSLRNRCLMTLLFCTGIRRCEAARLNKNSIKSQGGKFYLVFVGKGNKEAKVILPKQCYELIQTYLKARGKVRSTDPLFISLSRKNYGQRLGVDAVGRIAKAALQAAGFDGEDYVCHSCRHSFASILLDVSESDKSISLKNIQIAMRHSSITTTEIYLHSRDVLNNPATSRVADIIFGEMMNNVA